MGNGRCKDMKMKAVLVLAVTLVISVTCSTPSPNDVDINPHPDYCTNRCTGKNCGCHNRYCWTYCITGWCYTNGEFQHSQNRVYVPCDGDDHHACCPGWSCAGTCTL